MPTRRNKTKERIATKVRELRKQRRWTQAELARRLGLSQSRLSEIERGAGSFTAEQFLTILSLFNVAVTDFVPELASDPDALLQKALARLGASHLHESDEIVPNELYNDLGVVVRETLVVGSPRLLTALGPVLVNHVDRIRLKKLHARLTEAGLERRLGWLIDNVLDAIRSELKQAPPRLWAKRYRRAAVVLDTFLEYVGSSSFGRPNDAVGPDILDPSIRTKRTLEEVKASSSPISQRWNIVTGLQPDDFSHALREARAGL
jgi:transcriptional regulator with XRE-family HTH domain